MYSYRDVSIYYDRNYYFTRVAFEIEVHSHLCVYEETISVYPVRLKFQAQ